MFHCIAKGTLIIEFKVEEKIILLNHKFSTTCAMNMYANVNKLRLQTRLYMYTYYHNDTYLPPGKGGCIEGAWC